MGLKKYSEKRNFNNTPEPKAKKNKPGKSLSFVVQRHDASHLHYDFRLEMEGVLKSWAVPKGPSMNPDDKRLAMMVEDHPFEYRKFYGTIPEGNYGAGDVQIWDEGTYYPTEKTSDDSEDEKELLKELKNGNIKFTLNGKHLKGDFDLVKIKGGKYGDKGNAWLLIKRHDKYAESKAYNIENHLSIHRQKRSVKKKAPKSKQEKDTEPEKETQESDSGERVHVSGYIKPMLAKQTNKPFDDDGWLFEIKWDGFRAIAETGKNFKFYSRNGLSFINRFPEIGDELAKIKTPLVLDGEVVAMDEKGMPSFQLLQNYQSNASSIAYYVFDILKKDRKDLTHLTLTERKKILKATLKTNSLIRYSDDIKGDGIKFFELSAKKNLEGIMAKRADSIYQVGTRTGDWLKIKNHKEQEVVIAGFTKPRNSRKYFGALILGVYKAKDLIYCGHTGTGFDSGNLKEVYNKLIRIKQKESPFKERIKTNAPVTWVKPVYVCEIKYSEITGDGIMRHPVFLGLREDKKATEVVNETKNMVKHNSRTPVKKKVKGTSLKNGLRKDPVSREVKADDEVKVDGHLLKLSNQKKIYFPKDKITKGDILKYYQSVADYILPYLKNRPQSLYRNPNGIAEAGFFQKDMRDEGPEWLKTETIFSESNNKNINYLICNDKATLAYMNNLGCIELNTWHSQIKSLNKPDYIAIDLDPSPKNTFEQVIETAQAVKKIFDKAGIETYCKTSGATGLHIYAPLAARYSYDQVKDFVNLIAIKANELVPDITSLERSLKKRGEDKIYIDYLQNREGQTLASVYSVRPKPGATVSTPLEWKEVKKGLTPHDFTINNIHARLKKKGDIFKAVLGKGIDLMQCLKRLEKK